MKGRWEVKKLGEACEFQRGLTYAKVDEVEVSANIVLRATNINLATNRLDFSELKYINENVIVPISKKVKKHSLMICTASGSKSHLGKVAYIDGDYDYAFGGFMGMITPKANLVSKYLFHLMTSDAYKDFISELSDGSNINNLKFDDLRNFEIPVPPLPEQQRIVALLDEAFAAIATARANAEKNLKNARALFDSYLNSVFTQRGDGWVEKSLEQICSKITDGEHIRPQMVASGVPFLSAKDVLDDKIFFTDSLFVSEIDAVKFRKRCNPEQGDILIVSRGATVGRTCVVNTREIFCLLGSVILLKVGANYSSHFIAYALKSPAIRNQLMTVSEATAQPAIYLRDIKPLWIGCPSLTEQKEIVERLDSLREETQRLEAIYQKKLVALDALKKSILHQAFMGEL